MQNVTIGRTVHFHAGPGDTKPEHAVVIDVTPGSDVVTLKSTNCNGTDSTRYAVAFGGTTDAGWRWPPRFSAPTV